MSILLLEGFDHQDTILNWQYNQIGLIDSEATIQSSFARTGKALLLKDDYSNGMVIPLETQKTVLYVGFAFYLDGSLPSTDKTIFLLFDATNYLVAGITIKTTGHLVLRSVGTTVLATTSTAVITYNTWYYIEIKATISNSVVTDDCIVKLDGVEILNPASGDTRNTSSYISSVHLYGCNAAPGFYIDDLYIDDSDFLGQLKIATLFPSSSGTSDFVGSDGNSVNNNLLVDETQIDTTDYLDGGSGDVQLFDMDACPAGEIKGVEVRSIVTKTFKGKAVTGKLRVDSYQSDAHSVREDKSLQSVLLESNPATAGIWTQSAIDAAQFGVEVV